MLSVKREEPYENRIAGIGGNSRYLHRVLGVEQDRLPPLAQAVRLPPARRAAQGAGASL